MMDVILDNAPRRDAQGRVLVRQESHSFFDVSSRPTNNTVFLDIETLEFGPTRVILDPSVITLAAKTRDPLRTAIPTILEGAPREIEGAPWELIYYVVGWIVGVSMLGLLMVAL